MMSFGALKYFGSVIKKLKKILVLYQPRDLHLWMKYMLIFGGGLSQTLLIFKLSYKTTWISSPLK